MSTTRFSTGKAFTWQGDPYTVKRLLPGHQLRIENEVTGQGRVVAFQELVEALVAGQLAFLDDGEPASGLAGKCIDLSDYPSHLQAIAKYRLAVIKPLLALGQTTIGKETVLARVQVVKVEQERGIMPQMPLSVPSVYRWLRDYVRGGQDIRALVPGSQRRGGKGQPRLLPEVDTIIQSVIGERTQIVK